MSFDKMNEIQLDQSHDKVPPASSQVQTTTKRTTRERNDEEWESHKQEIKDMWLTRNWKLNYVMNTLEEKYNFRKSKRTWKCKLEEWGFRKNISSLDKDYIAVKAEKRKREEGKDTVFFYHNSEVPRSRIENSRSRRQVKAVSPNAVTPPNISYHTPRPESPPQILTSPRYHLEPRMQDELDSLSPNQPLGIRDENHSFDHVSDMRSFHHSDFSMPGEVLQPISQFGAPHQFKEEQKKSIPMTVPPTDSGYQSARNRSFCQNIQPPCKKSQCPPNNVYSLGDHKEDFETKTLYSSGSTVDASQARNYIVELTNHIHGKVHPSIDPKGRSMLSMVLPELIKAFAFKIYHDNPTQETRNIMYFIHKRHREIVTLLEGMFRHDDDDDSDRYRRNLGAMSLIDKMSMWNSKSGQVPSLISKDEIFQGVDDDDEGLLFQNDANSLNEAVLETTAYKWFLTTLATESTLQWGTSGYGSIRQTILGKLPTGTLSKRRNPSVHEVTFHLEWGYHMQVILMKEIRYPDRFNHDLIIATGSALEAQGLTIKQYILQTWPIIGLQLFEVLQRMSGNLDWPIYANLAGNVQLEVQMPNFDVSRLSVTATGPAYFVATCGESLAWIGSALLSNTKNIRLCYIQPITNFRIDPVSSTRTFPQHKYNCDIDLKVTSFDDSNRSLIATHSVSQGVIGTKCFIQRFPIRRRPDGYAGFEVSYDVLLCSLRARNATLLERQTVIKGQERALKLVKHTDDIFLWHLLQPLVNDCSCRVECDSEVDSDQMYSNLDVRLFEAGRHILGECTNNIILMEDQGRLTDKGAVVGIKAADSCPSNESNLVESQNEAQSRSPLPTLSKPQQDGTAFTPSTTIAIDQFVSDVHSSEWLGEVSESPGSLSNETSLFSTDSELVSTMESPEDSLSIDMLSVSDSSRQFELLDSSEEIYPILSLILNQLLSEFRNYTSCQFVSGECQIDSGGEEAGGEQSGSASSTVQSSSNGNTSRSSQKRKAPSKDNDDNSREDGLPPLPKRHNADRGKDLQRTLACPYLKRDPIKYTSCCSKKLTRIRDVKQHLTRAHYSELYCQSCQAINFPDEESLQRHIRTGKCSYQDPTTSDRMSHHQRGQLGRKSEGNASVEDQWFAIWEIIFGQHPRPSSIYLDANLTRQMLQFRAYCCLRGPTLLREHIESDSTWMHPETAEEQRQTYLERLILQGINGLFEDWHSSDPLGSGSPVRGTDNQEQQEDEIPTSTMVHSRLEIGVEASSSESRSQRNELPISSESSSVLFALPINNHVPALWTDSGGLMASSHTDSQTFLPATFGHILEESRSRNEEDHSREGDIGFHNAMDFDLNVDGLEGIAELLGYSSYPLPSFLLDPVNEVYPRSLEIGDDNNGFQPFPHELTIDAQFSNWTDELWGMGNESYPIPDYDSYIGGIQQSALLPSSSDLSQNDVTESHGAEFNEYI